MATHETSSDCNSHATEGGPRLPTVEEVLQCQFSKWYDSFRNVPNYRRSHVTVKSIILPLPRSFIDYLLTDRVYLPQGATKVSSCLPPESSQGNEWSSDDNEDSTDDDEHDEPLFSFPQLNEQISSAIASLGGSVMPKLNWSAPKDASWMNHGTLKCQTPGDVYLLLKSSDFVLHDVLHALDNVVDDEHKSVSYELALRKWCNLHPSMEFRCFVNRHKLVAISQRNHTQHFAHLQREKAAIQALVVDFFQQVVRHRFAHGQVERYCFDIYLDKKDRIWLLDFNVWGVQTDALLFEWSELLQIQQVEFRVVETELEIRQDPLASYRSPIDTIHLASGEFEEFMAMCEPPSQIK